jgi:tetratricopeptide (TPR) repeat protein
MQMAMKYFDLASDLDPDWAMPYVGLAESWAYQRQMKFSPPVVTLTNIYKYLSIALQLDPNSAEMHYLQAVIAVWTEWDWEKGEKEFLKAIELNPNHALAHALFAHFLMILHRTDKALFHASMALELDPLRPFILGLYAVVLGNAGNDEVACTQIQKALSIEPDHHFVNKQLWEYAHFYEDYVTAFEALKIIIPFDAEVISSLEKTFSEKGYFTVLNEIVNLMEIEIQKNYRISPWDIANLHSKLKNYSKEVEFLVKAYEMHDATMPYLSLNYSDSIRSDPRIREILKNMNLPLSRK